VDRWNASEVLADSASLDAGSSVSEDVSGLSDPVVLVALEDLEGSADDTATIRVVGAAGTYTVDERTLSETGSYTVDIPQVSDVEFESSNGVTYSAEVRANPH
jgi:hypothetical protein